MSCRAGLNSLWSAQKHKPNPGSYTGQNITLKTVFKEFSKFLVILVNFTVPYVNWGFPVWENFIHQKIFNVESNEKFETINIFSDFCKQQVMQHQEQCPQMNLSTRNLVWILNLSSENIMIKIKSCSVSWSSATPQDVSVISTKKMFTRMWQETFQLSVILSYLTSLPSSSSSASWRGYVKHSMISSHQDSSAPLFTLSASTCSVEMMIWWRF